jgi:carboxyl-terminal processing protease
MGRYTKQLALVLLLICAVTAVVQPPSAAASAGPRWLGAAAAPDRPGQVVKQAFDLLMDRYVIPPGSAVLLNGGWEAAVAALKEREVRNLPEARLELSDDRAADWRTFADRYPRLAAAAEGKLEQEWLDRAIIDGMARSLDEGHTYYLTPEAYRRSQQEVRNNNRFVGVGVVFNRDLIVTEVIEGGPADAGGVRAGDQVLEVNGESIEGVPFQEVSPKIRGDAGTPVELTLRRQGVAEPIRLSLVRREIRIEWVSHKILEDGIGYLRLRNFPLPQALGVFRQTMERFDEADIRGLVIDVRGNPGGAVDTGVEVASRFVRNGPLYQQVDRRGGQRTVTAFGDFWKRDVPIAILVDSGSGSMSEILASALQENGVGYVIGVRTAGVVAAAIPMPLEDGSGLSVTVQIINSGQGKVLNKVGVEPDRVVELDPASYRNGRDNQLEAAVGYVLEEAANRPAVSNPVRGLTPPPSIADALSPAA